MNLKHLTLLTALTCAKENIFFHFKNEENNVLHCYEAFDYALKLGLLRNHIRINDIMRKEKYIDIEIEFYSLDEELSIESAKSFDCNKLSQLIYNCAIRFCDNIIYQKLIFDRFTADLISLKNFYLDIFMHMENDPNADTISILDDLIHISMLRESYDCLSLARIYYNYRKDGFNVIDELVNKEANDLELKGIKTHLAILDDLRILQDFWPKIHYTSSMHTPQSAITKMRMLNVLSVSASNPLDPHPDYAFTIYEYKHTNPYYGCPSKELFENAIKDLPETRYSTKFIKIPDMIDCNKWAVIYYNDSNYYNNSGDCEIIAIIFQNNNNRKVFLANKHNDRREFVTWLLDQ